MNPPGKRGIFLGGGLPSFLVRSEPDLRLQSFRLGFVAPYLILMRADAPQREHSF
jgi:hypothetical protein